MNVRTEYQQFDTATCQKIQRSLMKPFGVCAFNVRTGGNVGMIVRSACNFGAQEVITCGRRHYDKRFTVGSENYIPVTHWEEPLKVHIDVKSPTETTEYNAEAFFENCKKSGWTPVFLEQGGEDIRDVAWKTIDRPLLIVGNESCGIPKEFMKGSKTVSIPQWSVMRSLNVAVAASLAIWELTCSFSNDAIDSLALCGHASGMQK
jgi:tRNA G18 (ribose-2'-O)-methylase SpoU